MLEVPLDIPRQDIRIAQLQDAPSVVLPVALAVTRVVFKPVLVGALFKGGLS